MMGLCPVQFLTSLDKTDIVIRSCFVSTFAFVHDCCLTSAWPLGCARFLTSCCRYYRLCGVWNVGKTLHEDGYRTIQHQRFWYPAMVTKPSTKHVNVLASPVVNVCVALSCISTLSRSGKPRCISAWVTSMPLSVCLFNLYMLDMAGASQCAMARTRWYVHVSTFGAVSCTQPHRRHSIGLSPSWTNIVRNVIFLPCEDNARCNSI